MRWQPLKKTNEHMNNNERDFLVRAEPLTWFMAALGVGVYGLPVIWLILRDGIPSIGHLIMVIWGLTMMCGTLWFLWLTFKAKRSLKQQFTQEDQKIIEKTLHIKEDFTIIEDHQPPHKPIDRKESDGMEFIHYQLPND